MKNIIFDLGGVLLIDKPISILNKIDIDESEYNKLSIFFDDWNNLDLGLEMLIDKFNSCNIDIKYKDILTKYYELRDINSNLLELVNKFKNNGYKVYILSDNNIDAANYYRNKYNIFDGMIYSCDYNTLKKDGKLFKILLDKYNLIPSECYFIDNSIDNITIGNKYGIYGYLYDNYENLLLDMKDKGVNYYE